MKPDRMLKYGAGIWKKWMRKVPKNMKWNEYVTKPVSRNTIKQCWIKQFNQEKNTVNHTDILSDLIDHAEIMEVADGVLEIDYIKTTNDYLQHKKLIEILIYRLMNVHKYVVEECLDLKI